MSSRAVAIAAFVVCVTAAAILAHAAVSGPGRSGGLRLVTRPAGASAFLDGEFVGVTPVSLQTLDARPHALRFEKAGFAALATRLEAGLQPTGDVTFSLSPVARGTLTVSSNPRGAEVFVDGRFRGITPLNIEAVPAGERLLRVEKSNHTPWSGSVLVEDGGQHDVECELEDRVLEFLKRALVESPDDILRYVELGHYYIVKAEPELAAETYKKGRELAQKPGVPKEKRNRLEKQIRKDMMSRGRVGERFRIAIQPPRAKRAGIANPKEALARAAKEEKAGRPKVAADILENSLRRNPTHIELAQKHARLRVTTGDRAKAPAALSEVFRRTGTQLEPRMELAALCLKHKGKFDETRRRTLLGLCATQLATARGKKRVGGAESALLLAKLYLESNRGGQAIPLLEDALRVERDADAKSKLHLELGLAFVAAKRYDDAREELSKAREFGDAVTRKRADEALAQLPEANSR